MILTSHKQVYAERDKPVDHFGRVNFRSLNQSCWEVLEVPSLTCETKTPLKN